MRIEATNGVPLGRLTTLLDLKAALEAAGIEFVGNADDRPGIRLGKKQFSQESALGANLLKYNNNFCSAKRLILSRRRNNYSIFSDT